MAIIRARNISKFSKHHSPLRGLWYFGQFSNIIRGFIAKYHYKSCYYLVYIYIKISSHSTLGDIHANIWDNFWYWYWYFDTIIIIIVILSWYNKFSNPWTLTVVRSYQTFAIKLFILFSYYDDILILSRYITPVYQWENQNIIDTHQKWYIMRLSLKTAKNVWESFWYIKNDSEHWYSWTSIIRTRWDHMK